MLECICTCQQLKLPELPGHSEPEQSPLTSIHLPEISLP